MRLRNRTILVLAIGLSLLAAETLRTQDAPETSPSAALSSALMAACRQAEAQFARYLTADNAAVFRTLAPGARTALMKRFVLLDDPGRPQLSSDPQGRTAIRCETPGITTEMRFGETRLRENLAFIPVEVSAGDLPLRQIEFGMVHESGGWKLISVGLLLLDLPTLARQWEQAEVEAREAAAIAALRKAASAISTYRRAFGKLPETLAQLGPAPKEGISPEAAGLLDAELTAGKKGGYVFRYVILPAPGGGAEDSFELAAMPAEYSKTGRRSFFLDASGTLHGGDKQGAVATSSDPRVESR